jgi:hypothetical protein
MKQNSSWMFMALALLPDGFVLLTQNEKVPLKELNLTQHLSAKAPTFKVKRKS